jgi:hypothetical protein
LEPASLLAVGVPDLPRAAGRVFSYLFVLCCDALVVSPVCTAFKSFYSFSSGPQPILRLCCFCTLASSLSCLAAILPQAVKKKT